MNLGKLLTVSRRVQVKSIRWASWYKSLFKVDQNEPPYNHCVQIGDPVLRSIADPIPAELITSSEIKYLVTKMQHVLKAYNLVGVSAPQIGISLRCFIISFGDGLKKTFSPEIYKKKEMSTFPSTVFINPELKVLDHRKITFEEGCASVVGYVGEVSRNYSVEVTALNLKGETIKHQLSGWNARIAQHENDHLNGILFTDLMDRKTFRCSNWEIINRKQGKLEIPYYPK